MRIGLFIPCFVDAFFLDVGIATLELLERFGHRVVYPRGQIKFIHIAQILNGASK